MKLGTWNINIGLHNNSTSYDQRLLNIGNKILEKADAGYLTDVLTINEAKHFMDTYFFIVT